MNFWSAFEMLAAAMDGRLALPRSRGQRCPAHRVLCLPGKGHHLAEGAHHHFGGHVAPVPHKELQKFLAKHLTVRFVFRAIMSEDLARKLKERG
jgi:hypothetical protein